MSNAGTEREYEAFLTNVGNLMEAEILISLLESEGIPVRKKHNLTGDYLEVLANYTPFGVDLYVPPEKLDQAKELLSTQAEISDEEVFGETSPKEQNMPVESNVEQRWRLRKQVIIGMIWIGILVPLAFMMLYYSFA